jgi:hypothetical protein
MKHVVDGHSADVNLFFMWRTLRTLARETFAHLDQRSLPPGMRAPWRTLRAQLRRKVMPDPPGGMRATDWEFAQISCGHLCQLAAAVGSVICAAERLDADTFSRCELLAGCWQESNRMVAAFWDASREHANAIDALFNTEAST